MSLWEYKHITSGPHGFATPALLESYLNQLGKDEWEIVSFQPSSANPLAFNGIARRTTLRDWTLESAAAAVAKAEADKLRAEFAAKFQGAAAAPEASTAEKPASLLAEEAAAEDGFRKLRDTTRDDDPDAPEESDWDNFDDSEDDLPTLFEAIKPHLRKNQRGPGQSVGILFLSKRWEQTEADLVGALKECGFAVPETEDAPPEYLEFEGDLYWLNLNNRHELFLNTREKPRPVFRVAQARKLDASDPASAVLAEEAAAEQAEKTRRETERLAREAEQAARRAERDAARQKAEAERAARRASPESRAESPEPRIAHGNSMPSENDGAQVDASAASAAPEVGASGAPVASAPLPQGEELLAVIRPQMRRNRRGPGYSGSVGWLSSRAFHCAEADLVAALAALGLHAPATPEEKPVRTPIGAHVYWLNKDSRGGIWINGDEAREPKASGLPGAAPSAAAPVAQPEASSSAPEAEPMPAVAAPSKADASPVAAVPEASDEAKASTSVSSSEPEPEPTKRAKASKSGAKKASGGASKPRAKKAAK